MSSLHRLGVVERNCLGVLQIDFVHIRNEFCPNFEMADVGTMINYLAPNHFSQLQQAESI